MNVFLGLFVVQVHFAGIALSPGNSLSVLRFRWWRKLVPVLIGAALAIAAMLPYFYYLIVIDPSILSRLRAGDRRRHSSD